MVKLSRTSFGFLSFTGLVPVASSDALAAGAKFLAAATTGLGAMPVFARGADLADADLTGRLTVTFGFAMARVAAIFFDGSDLTVTIQQLLKKTIYTVYTFYQCSVKTN
jgi:hypothetical protein